MAILLKDQSISKPVMDLIYDKQRDLKKEKGRPIGLAKTIERLLKDAYLKGEEGKNIELRR